MSHYNVNASVPKTLIQHLIALGHRHGPIRPGDGRGAAIDPGHGDFAGAGAGRNGDQEGPGQSTEEKIGPYELQDFNIYYITRFGFRPSKVAFLCHTRGVTRRGAIGRTYCPSRSVNQYDLATIKKWLDVFLYRFFKTSQFKRSCLPNGPKVGSGGSLSPRGDWRAPSDSEAVVWLDELRRNVPD